MGEPSFNIVVASSRASTTAVCSCISPDIAAFRTMAERSSKPSLIMPSASLRTSNGRVSKAVSRRRTPIDLSIQRQRQPTGHSAFPLIKLWIAAARTAGWTASTDNRCKCTSILPLRSIWRRSEAIDPVAEVPMMSARQDATSGLLKATFRASRSRPQRPQVACRVSNTDAASATIRGGVEGNVRAAHSIAAFRTGSTQSFSRHATVAKMKALGNGSAILCRAASRIRPSR